VSQRGSLSEAELTKRRSGLVGMVVFHQDMGHDANQAYFLKELQRQNEKYYDNMSAQAKEQLGMESAMKEQLYSRAAQRGRQERMAPDVVWHDGEDVWEPGKGPEQEKDGGGR
jgi:hypothetical protein